MRIKRNHYYLILFVLAGISACGKVDTTPASPELKSCYIEYLFFRDDILMSSAQEIGFPPGSFFTLKLSYLRENGRPVRTIGGFAPVPQGTGGISYMFYDLAYDSLVSRGDSVSLYGKGVNGEGVTWENSQNPVVFVTGPEGRIARIGKKNIVGGNFNLVYHYSGNTIEEWAEADYLNRTYYLENGNLVRIVQERLMPDSVAGFRKEYLFSDFDDKPNPFRGRYYLRGAFFRAFSAHNYQRYAINQFTWVADSGWIQESHSEYWAQLSYSAEGYPMFGEY